MYIAKEIDETELIQLYLYKLHKILQNILQINSCAYNKINSEFSPKQNIMLIVSAIEQFP